MSSGQQLLRSPDAGSYITDNNGSPDQVNPHPLTDNQKGIGKSSFFKDMKKDSHLADKTLTQKKEMKLNQLASQSNNAYDRDLANKQMTNEEMGANQGTPTSGVRLLQKKESVKTERIISGNNDLDRANSMKDELVVNAPLQKLQTLRSNFKTSELDLKNQHVETNINPGIIQDQEEFKEQGKLVRKNDKSSELGSRKLINNQNEEGKSSHAISEQSGPRIRSMKTRKSEIFANIVEDEEDILDLKLNLDEEPATQGSQDQILKVEEVKPEKCILSHASNFRLRWDLWIILLVLFNCIQIPLQLAFSQLDTVGLDTFGYIVDVQFVFDIFFNFRTTYINEKTGLEVKDGKVLAKRYVKHWRFYVDIVSIIPFELLYDAFSIGQKQQNKTELQVFNLLKLVRLLRLGRIITYLKLKQDIKVGFRIFQLLFMLLLIVHWIGCLWYMLIDNLYWIPPFDANYGTTDFYQLDMWSQYAIVYYYAIILLFGGDILPVDSLTVCFGFVVVILGSICSAFIFGNMAALMSSGTGQYFQELFDSIQKLMRNIQLPPDIQNEVETYLLHIQQVPDLHQDMQDFLNLLSPSLRSSVLFHLYSSIIKKIKIFSSCSNIELRYVVNFMKTVIFLPGDEVIRQGDKGNKIYFISRGKVSVFIGPDDQSEIQDQELNAEKHLQNLINQKADQIMETGNSSPRSGRSGNVHPNQEGRNAPQQVQHEGGEEEEKSPGPAGIRRNTLKDQVSSSIMANKDNKKQNSKGSFLGDKSSHDASSILDKVSQNPVKFIKDLEEGDYFGEISLITHLKRTATIKAKDFTTLGYMQASTFREAKEEFPQIYHSFKKEIINRYKDENFKFRQNMISNVPYFRNLSPLIVQELIYLLRPSRFDPNMLILKRGDSTDKIFFVKAGTVDIEVPLKNNEKMHFDTLNPGSCFCIFSAFQKDKVQKFDFRARTVCVVETILASDIIGLQKEHMELSDEVKTLMVLIESGEKSDFDFFRYLPKRVASLVEDKRRNIVKRKFRLAMAKFFRKLQESKAILNTMNLKSGSHQEENQEAIYEHILNQNNGSDGNENAGKLNPFKALKALDKLEKERKEKEQKLKFLKEKCSNSSLFALTSLLSKKKSIPESAKILEVTNGEGDQDQLDVGEEMKDGNLFKAVQRNFDYNHSQTIFNSAMNDESVEMDAQSYPRIDTIRRELLKMKEEGNFNTDEINEVLLLNNTSYNVDVQNISAQKNSPTKQQVPPQTNYNIFRGPQTSINQGSSVIMTTVHMPELDPNEIKQIQADEPVLRMQTQTQNEYIATLENNNDQVDLKDVVLEERKTPYEDLLLQPSWRKKMMQLNLNPIAEENKREMEEKSAVSSPVMIKKRTKFDNITLKKEEVLKKGQDEKEPDLISFQADGRSNQETKTGLDGQSNSQEELILVLNQINQSLLTLFMPTTKKTKNNKKKADEGGRKQNINGLQRDLEKKMERIERKIEKVVQIDNEDDYSPGILGYRPAQSPTTRIIKGALKYQPRPSQDENLDLVKKETFLSVNPHKMSSAYPNSDYQFLQPKNQILSSPLQRVQSQVAEPQPIQDLLQKEKLQQPMSSRQQVGMFGGVIGQYSHKIGDGTIQTSNRPNQKLGSLYAPKILSESPRSMKMEEQKNYQIQTNPQMYQSREGINKTPYFISEYQETIIDNNLPLVNNLKPDQDEVSEKASTQHKELAQTGPAVTKVMQTNFKREISTNIRNQKRVNATSGGGIGAMGSKNIVDLYNFNDSQELIDINDNDMAQLHDNTVILEEQLDNQLDRQILKDDENRMKFQVELALQIYACWPPNQQNLMASTPQFQNQGSNQQSGRGIQQHIQTIQASTPKNSNSQITINNTNNINNLTIRNNYPLTQNNHKPPNQKQ